MIACTPDIRGLLSTHSGLCDWSARRRNYHTPIYSPLHSLSLALSLSRHSISPARSLLPIPRAMGRITSGSSTDSLRLNAAAFHYRYCLTSFTNPSTEPGRRSIADRKNRGRREQVPTITRFYYSEPEVDTFTISTIYKLRFVSRLRYIAFDRKISEEGYVFFLTNENIRITRFS